MKPVASVVVDMVKLVVAVAVIFLAMERVRISLLPFLAAAADLLQRGVRGVGNANPETTKLFWLLSVIVSSRKGHAAGRRMRRRQLTFVIVLRVESCRL